MAEHPNIPIEEIPNEDDLFYRVDVNGLTETLTIHPGCFRENKGALSCDWEKYRSALQTKAATGKASQFAVIRLNAGKLRGVVGLTVLHEPLPENIAHSGVHGMGPSGKIPPEQRARREGIRLELYRRFKEWEIPPYAP